MLTVRSRADTVSESTVSNPEVSENFEPHRVPGTELSEFMSAYVCQSELTEFFIAELTEFALELGELYLFRDSTLEAVLRLFPSSPLRCLLDLLLHLQAK